MKVFKKAAQPEKKEENQSPGHMHGEFKPVRRFPIRVHLSKKAWLGIAGVVLLLVAVGSAATFFNVRKQKPVNIALCSTLPISDKIDSAVDEIMKLKDYEKDPNCLYILTEHSITKHDSLGSKTYIEKLTKAVAKEHLSITSKDPTHKIRTVGELQALVDDLQAQTQALRKGAHVFVPRNEEKEQ